MKLEIKELIIEIGSEEMKEVVNIISSKNSKSTTIQDLLNSNFGRELAESLVNSLNKKD